MILRIHPDNPDQRQILQVAELLRKGGIIIYPTDTIYGLGCDIFNHKAVERIARIKGVKTEKTNFSFICYDLSHISDYTKQLDNNTFKLMRKYLPGPYTFILNANSRIPKLFKNKKKTVGIRIPNNKIALEIVKELGNPILSTSIHDDDEVIEYSTDPDLIHEKYKSLVDLVIDGGFGHNVPSTIINCITDTAEIMREGLGVFDE
ncbi:MAG: threonylcarbamoyl-AMP synthase [Bacteroidales bacterium]|nr:threonylcarbamoyl-AMP synthase [Bacteroidales bacterium]